MSLSARAIAVSGFGYGALLVAVSGLLGVTVEPPITPPSVEIGGVGPPQRVPKTGLAARRIREEDEFILAFIAAVTTSGLLEQ